jgi:hypothetical protein
MDFIYLPGFVKRLKALSKKCPSLKNDFSGFLEQLKKFPQTGTHLGKDCYKIRLAIKSKSKGKNGGARVISCVKIQNDTIYFLAIYDKSELSSISDLDLKVFVDSIHQTKE